jgi:hypothetical protein
MLPAFTAAVWTLLHTAQRHCMPSAQAEILQQMASSGLFKTLDQLSEATAQQLEQRTAAAAAVAAGGGLEAFNKLQGIAGRLLWLQVCRRCAVLNSKCLIQHRYGMHMLCWSWATKQLSGSQAVGLARPPDLPVP